MKRAHSSDILKINRMRKEKKRKEKKRKEKDLHKGKFLQGCKS
jgi:hypothetical protein